MDDASRKATAAKDRERAIIEHETELYESLWSELKQHIESAKTKGFPRLHTNGTDLARVVTLPTDDPLDNMPNTLTLALSKATHEIQAIGSFGYEYIKLQIDVCGDGFVCLKLQGKQLSLKEAAIRILWPFLYPDAGPYSGPRGFIG